MSLSTDDRFALLELVARYAHAVDSRDVDAIVACFASDARLEFASTANAFTGHAAIAEFYDGAFASPRLGDGATSTHMMANTLITDSEGGADVVTSAVAYLATSAVVDHTDRITGRVLVRGITYTDRCVRAGERWVFAERVHRLQWQGEMPGGAQTADPFPPR